MLPHKSNLLSLHTHKYLSLSTAPLALFGYYVKLLSKFPRDPLMTGLYVDEGALCGSFETNR